VSSHDVGLGSGVTNGGQVSTIFGLWKEEERRGDRGSHVHPGFEDMCYPGINDIKFLVS
jgi:hypothetical protein